MSKKQFQFAVRSPVFIDESQADSDVESFSFSVDVRVIGGLLIGVRSHTEDSRLESLRDSTGRNLTESSRIEYRSELLNGSYFSIECDVLPDPKASSLSAKGHVVVQTADGIESKKSTLVVPQLNATTTVGEFDFLLISVETFDDGVEIEFQRNTTEAHLSGSKGIRFEDGTGKQLRVERLGKRSRSSNGKVKVTDQFLFPFGTERFVVVADFWIGRVEEIVEFSTECQIEHSGR